MHKCLRIFVELGKASGISSRLDVQQDSKTGIRWYFIPVTDQPLRKLNTEVRELLTVPKRSLERDDYFISL